jgi:cytochrome P450
MKCCVVCVNLSIRVNYSHVVAFIEAMVARYGPIFRLWFGPTLPTVVISDMDMIKQVLITDKAKFTIPDRPGLKWLTGESLLTTDGDKWRKHRTLLNPAFHHIKLQHMVQVFNQNLPPFFRLLDAHAASGAVVDMAALWPRLTLQIIGLSAFHTDLQCLDDQFMSSPLYQAFETVLSIKGPLERKSWFALLCPCLQRFTAEQRKIRAARALIRDLANDIAFRRLQLAIARESAAASANAAGMDVHPDPTDLLDLLVNVTDAAGQHLSVTEIVDECMAFLFAGHDTTAVLMTWFTWAMGQHPHIDAKLHAELNANIPLAKLDQVDHITLGRCEFLKQCIDETFRLHPPAPLVQRRLMEPLTLGGHALPAHTNVLIPIFLMHKHPELWAQHTDFDPELHFGAHSKQGSRAAFFPYGPGTT